MDPRQVTLARVLTALEPVAREEILKTFRLDSCVATTQIIRAVLGEFGFASTHQMTRVRVMNPTYAQMLNGPRPQTEEAVQAWMKRGAWEVAIGYGQEQDPFLLTKRGLDGHMVARVDDLLIDASIDQATRITKNLVLPPLLLTKLDRTNWATGRGAIIASPTGVLVWYQPVQDRTESYIDSPDWLDSRGVQQPIVDRIVARLKKAL